MKVIDVLMSSIAPNTTLTTPVRRRKFVVDSISHMGVTLKVGKGWKIRILSECWNGVPGFLRGKGWVEIRGIKDPKTKPGTLEHYTRDFLSTSVGPYVAAVLKEAGIVEIDRRIPSKVQLIRTDLYA